MEMMEVLCISVEIYVPLRMYYYYGEQFLSSRAIDLCDVTVCSSAGTIAIIYYQ